jgi:hypothetical protein
MMRACAFASFVLVVIIGSSDPMNMRRGSVCMETPRGSHAAAATLKILAHATQVPWRLAPGRASHGAALGERDVVHITTAMRRTKKQPSVAAAWQVLT